MAKSQTDALNDRNPDVPGAAPVVDGTMVPVSILTEHPGAGDRFDEPQDDYPAAPRRRAAARVSLGR